MTIPKALAQELQLPVSFDINGEIVSLRDYLLAKTRGENSCLSFSSLSSSQKAKITAERIRREPEVKLGVRGAGVIDKQRAIAEVEALSPLGKTLIEAEEHIITHLIDAVQHGRLQEIVKEIHE